MDGVLVVDKPRGPTSHDVVAWARRALRTRAIGHAGTLDPMATGVLVLGIGEGTKLLPFLMGDAKEYETTIALGAETRSLDADGEVVAEAEVPPLDRDRVERAAAQFVGRITQRAPIVSAIKSGGVALHARARRGEAVEAPVREVECHGIDVLDVRAREIDLRIRCAKGFYVRALGRDLALALGTRGHLVRLRRVASGPFRVQDALDADVLRRRDPGIEARVLSLGRATASMEIVRLDARGARDLAQGKRVPIAEPARREPIAVFDPAGALVAIARWEAGKLRVIRGMRAPSSREEAAV